MNKRQKRGWLLVLLGLSMVLTAALMHTAQERQDALAGENSAVLLRQLKLSRTSLPTAADAAADPGEPEPPAAMPVKDYLGYSMIGTLRIPSLGMELPILGSWSYELLEIAPCRYSGSLPEGNMVLMGHNYKSHFTPLHHIGEDVAVEFEDVNGIVTHYRTAQIDILHESHVDQLFSEYPLTLFTCSAGGRNRLVVRCAFEE